MDIKADYFGLAKTKIEEFHLQGYVGPFTFEEQDLMAKKIPRINECLKNIPERDYLPQMIQRQSYERQHGFNRHIDNEVILKIATSPIIVDKIESLLGENIILWRTMFFIKDVGAPAIPWHQDYDDWPIEPYLVVTAWVAIDECDQENGCIQVLPGSHRQFYPIVETTGNYLETFTKMSDPETFNDRNLINMELKSGQFFLFNERLLHRSNKNNSKNRRVGLAIRYITPQVRVLDVNDRPVLIRGKDSLNFNSLYAPQY